MLGQPLATSSPRLDVAQSANLQRDAKHNVRHITGFINLNALQRGIHFLAQPQPMLALGRCEDTIQGSDGFSFRDIFSRTICAR